MYSLYKSNILFIINLLVACFSHYSAKLEVYEIGSRKPGKVNEIEFGIFFNRSKVNVLIIVSS